MNKKNIIAIVIACVAALFSTVVIGYYSFCALTSYQPFSYKEATIENFIAEAIDEEKLPEAVKEIQFTDEGNKFPYQYKEYTCYVDTVLSTSHYIFRIDDNHEDIALEYQSPLSKVFRSMETVHYYTVSEKDGEWISNAVQALKEQTAQKGEAV